MNECQFVASTQIEREYLLVISMYDTGRYTQKAISTITGIKLRKVASFTQYYGYKHTKAKNGKKPFYFCQDLQDMDN